MHGHPPISRQERCGATWPSVSAMALAVKGDGRVRYRSRSRYAFAKLCRTPSSGVGTLARAAVFTAAYRQVPPCLHEPHIFAVTIKLPRPCISNGGLVSLHRSQLRYFVIDKQWKPDKSSFLADGADGAVLHFAGQAGYRDLHFASGAAPAPDADNPSLFFSSSSFPSR